MIEKEVYFIEVIPFRIVKKNSDKTLMISSRGDYKNVDSAPLMNFKENDYLLMSRIIGEGFVQINYFKRDDKKIREYFQKRGLENLFSRFRGTALFPQN